MQFFTYDQVPEDQISVTFKDVAWRSLFGAMIVVAAITAYTAIPKGEPTAPLLIAVPTLLTAVFGLLFIRRFLQCRNPRNWLLKGADDGLYINLQSNITTPETENAPEVIFIPAENVVHITRVQESRTLPQRVGNYKNHFSFFDIRLQEPVPDALPVALAQIRRNPRLRGDIGYRRDLHVPLRVPDRYTIRLVWDWLDPRELAAAAWFESEYPVKPLQKMKVPGWSKMTPDERETYIDMLWEWGHVQDAVHLSGLTRTTSDRAAAKHLSDRLG